jgi:hypothetical protein
LWDLSNGMPATSKGAFMVGSDKAKFLQASLWAGLWVVAGVIAATMFLAANARTAVVGGIDGVGMIGEIRP